MNKFENPTFLNCDPRTIHGISSIAASIRLTKQRVAKLSLCRDGRKSNKFRRRFVRDALRRERRSRSPLGNNVAVLIPYVETTCSFCNQREWEATYQQFPSVSYAPYKQNELSANLDIFLELTRVDVCGEMFFLSALLRGRIVFLG